MSSSSLLTLPKPRMKKTKTTKRNTEIQTIQHDDDDDGNHIEVILADNSPSPKPTDELVLAINTATTLASSVSAVEKILGYSFRNKSLLEEALTHSSCTDSATYQRLEFVGDAALGLAVANFVFIAYPDLDPGQLSLLRSANISTEKLARVAVRNGLYNYMRHSAPSLDLKVSEFMRAIEAEGDEIFPYGGSVKAPKVLADLVESVAAAIYVDCNFDLKLLWEYFSPLLEPIVTLENLQQQPVTMLYELCQKQGKHLDFKNWRNGTKNICNVFVDGKLVAQGCSDQKDISKLTAAKAALLNMSKWETSALPMEIDGGMVLGKEEIDWAKQKLNELCDKNRCPRATFRVDFVPSVEVPDAAKDELNRFFSLHRIVYDLSFLESIVPWVLQKVRCPGIDRISSPIFVGAGVEDVGQLDVEDNFSADFEATFRPATDGPMLSDLAGGLLHIADWLGVTLQIDVADTSGSGGIAERTLVMEEGLGYASGATLSHDFEQVPLHRNGSQGPLIDHAAKMSSEQGSLDQIAALGKVVSKLG